MRNNELKIRVSGRRLDDAKGATRHHQEDIFKLVRASELRLDDDFMNHVPQTESEEIFMNQVKKVIKEGVHDFWRPVCDPSFDAKGRICYEPGKMPVVGKSFNWWAKTAENFKPEQGSRLGTQAEYTAFIAILIKELVANGWKVADAWDSVCNNSKMLGHYNNSENAKDALEVTGSREICGWCDLSNTNKIIAEDNTPSIIMEKDDEVGRFLLSAGNCYRKGNYGPLATVFISSVRQNADIEFGCGWIVLT